MPIVVAVAASLVGCSAPTGSATIDVRDLPAAYAGAEITVMLRDSAGENLDHLEVGANTTVTAKSLPLGTVDIEAIDFCRVTGVVDEANPTVRLIIDGRTCTLAD